MSPGNSTNLSPTPNLLLGLADVIRQLSPADLADPRRIPQLELERVVTNGRSVQMVYAPFDHVNWSARVAIVGLTPGKQQAVNALKAAHDALGAGASFAQAAERAKGFASFSGPMRANLVNLLDHIGLADWLGLTTTAQLWHDHNHLAHFTSALRYPVFVNGENWSGAPDMLRTEPMRRWLETYLGTEVAGLRSAVFVPLGPKVTEALRHLASLGIIPEDRILNGLPHPSGANAERIAYFLGTKSAERLSSRTNAAAIDAARSSLFRKVGSLQAEAAANDF